MKVFSASIARRAGAASGQHGPVEQGKKREVVAPGHHGVRLGQRGGGAAVHEIRQADQALAQTSSTCASPVTT
jgi:hypothetical protein